MGVELPEELRGLAERVGARWPEADEDAMRDSALAWREASDSIEELTRGADGTARGALGAIEGETARAAGREWEGVVDPDIGDLPVSAGECGAAADRLDHAAEQIGAAKVRIVRELVTLAEKTGAAERAAASGHPRALAGVETMMHATSARLAEVHDTLIRAVDMRSGRTVDAESSLEPPAAGRSTLNGSGTPPVAEAATDLSATAAGSVAESASSVVSAVTRETGGTASEATEQATERTAEQAVDAVDAVSGVAEEGAETAAASIAERLAGDGRGQPQPSVPEEAEHTGPVSADTVAGAAARPPDADAGTGPLPRLGVPSPSDVAASGTAAEPASNTAPQSVHQAWAAPAAGGTAMAQGFAAPPVSAPQAPAPSAYGQAGAYAAPPPSGHPAAGQASPGQAGQAVNSRAPRAPGSPPPPAARPPAPARGYDPAAPAAGAPQPAPRGAFRPGAVPAHPPAPPHAPPPHAQVDSAQRPSRQNERSPAVVAFVLHQFPIGHLPVVASRPSRQWSLSASGEDAPRTRYAPQDHPDSALVDDTEALTRVRSGEARSVLRHEQRSGTAPEERTVPAELLHGYDPLGTVDGSEHGSGDEDHPDGSVPLSEAEWERHYVARAASEGRFAEYRWPSWSGLPEGCVEPGEPVVLDADTVVDHFGDGGGRVLAAEGTVFARRSLPPEYRERDYRRYRVVRPLPVHRAVTAAWFGQSGGGVRYRTTYPITELVALGSLVELTAEATILGEEAVQEPTLRIPSGPAASGQAGTGPEPGRETGVQTEQTEQEVR